MSRRAPRRCPVCEERLLLTRLSCEACGTELSGSFEPCDYCSLSADDLDILRVFLTARGNMKELERHLGVSYPTARARFDDLLGRLGMRPGPSGDPTVDVLEALQRGEIDIDTADARLGT